MNSINDILKKLRESKLHEKRVDYSSMTLNDVISLCQDGDQQAIEYLLKQYEPLLNKMSRRYVLDTQDPDDLHQLAAVGFWDAVMKWDPERNEESGFVSHVKLVVNRKLTDALRSDSTEKAKFNTAASSMDDPIADDGEGGEMTLGDTIASKDASPEEEYLGREGARELMTFMRDKFSQKERDVVMLHIKGYKIADIMEETGMTYKSVENTLMRIKNKLADYLRARESKKIRESKTVEFSDEEKRVLESVLSKIDSEKAE